MSSRIPVEVVSVFTDSEGRFGNPLGLIRSSAATRGQEQRIATELDFSETVFVDEIVEPGGGSGGHGETTPHPRTAVIRIFTPVRELPFAGHPCVGTAWWLAEQGSPVTALRVPAGEVAVQYDGGLTWIAGRADWSPVFTWHELGSPADVDALEAAAFTEGNHYAWAWVDEQAGHVRSRMFAPVIGVAEDEATGSAAVRLTDLLGRDLLIDQGEGSRLLTRRLSGGFIEVGGRTVRSDSVDVEADPEADPEADADGDTDRDAEGTGAAS